MRPRRVFMQFFFSIGYLCAGSQHHTCWDSGIASMIARTRTKLSERVIGLRVRSGEKVTRFFVPRKPREQCFDRQTMSTDHGPGGGWVEDLL